MNQYSVSTVLHTVASHAVMEALATFWHHRHVNNTVFGPVKDTHTHTHTRTHTGTHTGNCAGPDTFLITLQEMQWRA